MRQLRQPRTPVRVALLCVAVVLGLLGRRTAVADEPARSPLFPEGQLTLIADPTSHSGGGVLTLSNPGADDVNLVLTAGDFISTLTHKGQSARVTFLGPTDTTGQGVYRGVVQKGQRLLLRVEATNLWEAGESVAPLYNNGDRIGALRALHYRPLFNVTLAAAAGADRPEIALRRGESRPAILRNDDGLTYQIDWTLSVHGSGALELGDSLLLPASSSRSIAIRPPDAWFTAAGYLREEVREGLLSLRFHPPGGTADPGWPTRALPVKLRLSRASDLWLQVVGYGALLLLLLAGGVSSLLLNNWVPNHTARQRLLDRLGLLGDRIRELSPRIDSKLQVSLRVARQRLRAELYKRWSFSAELPSVCAAVGVRADGLSRQIDQAAEIDRLLQKLEQRYTEGLPPKQLEEVEGRLKLARDLLSQIGPPPADTEAAQGLIDQARALLDKVGLADEAFARSLFERIAQAEGLRLAAPGPLRALQEALLGEAARFGAAGIAALRAQDYGALDTCLAKIELIADHAGALQGLDEETRGRYQDEGRFQAFLCGRSLDHLRGARGIVRQLQDAIFASDLERALQDPASPPVIRVEPQTARQYAPMHFSVEFPDARYSRCAALSCLRCEWDLGHDGMKEWGWAIWHYFPAATARERQTVTARFIGATGATVATACKPAVFDVAPDKQQDFGERNLVELVRLGMVLFVAMIGLLSGAREQLMKLDLVPAAVAVFLLGFGADSLKTLVLPKDRQ